jgi:penicillin-binding protein 2
VGVTTTRVPDAKVAAHAFLDAWKADDYETMYNLLTSVSQAGMTREEFVKHYEGVAAEAALSSVDYQLLSAITNPDKAQVSYQVDLSSSLVGDISRETLMNLGLEKGEWRVEWSDTLVLPELAGGNYLGMERFIPARANIYDRGGRALVAQADATAIGLYPDYIDPEQEDTLFAELTRLTGLRPDTIREMYANFPAGGGWYLSLGELPASEVESRYGVLSGLSGLVLSPYKARYYFDGGLAPHVTGYVGSIQKETLQDYLRKGYSRDELVGQTGLEVWGEELLSGVRGGALYVFNSGKLVTQLAERKAKASQAIYTTIDRELQKGAQEAIEGFNAAVVVLERDTGRVLAMASSPAFDPNAFVPSNTNFGSGIPEGSILNRATQGQYPLGSVFKIVTMAAALESERYTADSSYQCGYFFEEIAGFRPNDWTYDHFLQDGRTIPSGLLTLPQGLIRSCNPWFWHIGLDFYNAGMTKAISDMSRAFGLGSPTGIVGVDEAAGQIPDPVSEVDATNLAIGQGNMLVTPLQVARFIAAVGNGGTLYTPQVIERILPPDGDPSFEFKPEVAGKLPVSPENLKIIQDAMVGVVASTEPYGTAWHRFTGLEIPVAGKTGTATSGSGEPHAWFGGYTFAGQQDKPDIAVIVVVENIGEGSDWAAPIFRRIVEHYFYGQPQKLYWWESGFGVTRTPTPEFEYTPTPEIGPDGQPQPTERVP